MNIKSDPEVVQRWHTHHWIGNFEADLSMMASKPYEANLGRKNPQYGRGHQDGQKIRKTIDYVFALSLIHI